jgi:hypothetical protein
MNSIRDRLMTLVGNSVDLALEDGTRINASSCRSSAAVA